VGGPFRESLALVSDEIHSTRAQVDPSSRHSLLTKARRLDLLIPTPNQRYQMGAGRDRYILNSLWRDSLALAAYRCLGLVFGAALRSGVSLPIALASLVWKFLVHETPVVQDLEVCPLALLCSVLLCPSLLCSSLLFPALFFSSLPFPSLRLLSTLAFGYICTVYCLLLTFSSFSVWIKS